MIQVTVRIDCVLRVTNETDAASLTSTTRMNHDTLLSAQITLVEVFDLERDSNACVGLLDPDHSFGEDHVNGIESSSAYATACVPSRCRD
ncbi:MAG: hypothetical protein KF905_14815 [Flavobacteriales bacterium]|nr:hypothetical protein [Flavobacteriales bacterium]